MISTINAPFVVLRLQSLTEVPVWKVLHSGADRNPGALWGREVHLNEYSGWIQVGVPNLYLNVELKKYRVRTGAGNP